MRQMHFVRRTPALKYIELVTVGMFQFISQFIRMGLCDCILQHVVAYSKWRSDGAHDHKFSISFNSVYQFNHSPNV